MNNFKKLTVLYILLLFAYPAYPASTDIYSHDWSVAAKPSVLEAGFDKKSVAQFLDKVGAYENEPEEYKYKVEQIGDFRWIDIDNDGKYELLVTVATAPSGRVFFTSIAVFKQISENEFSSDGISVFTVEKFDGVIKDIDNDGQPELILPILLTSYYGARPMAIWKAIYKWGDGKFYDASAEFPDFYRKQIPELEARMQKFQDSKDRLLYDASPDEILFRQQIYEEGLSVDWIIRDKISRIIGENKKAGFEKAVEWSKSQNPNLRENAIFVFKEIGDKKSIRYLRSLVSDDNSIISSRARRAIKSLGAE